MKLRLLAFLFILLLTTHLHAQNIRPFKPGDRVVFTGNSITDGGHYHSYIWLYYLTHFPNNRIKIFNAGIGGDIAQQMYERLDTDVFSKKPTVVTLTFGMNDTGYQRLKADEADAVYGEKVAVSVKSFKLIAEKLKQHPGVRMVMIGSSPYDESSKNKFIKLVNKNAAMRQIAAEQQRVAQANGWGYVDFGVPMTAINLREQQRDSVFTLEGSDRIHPTNDAQMIMAWIFLKAQGLAGKKIADIAINAQSKKIDLAGNCTITNPVISANKISFTYLAKSLPYPMDTIPSGFGRPQKAQAASLKLIPFNEEFNQELLQVKGLKAKQLLLKIDGKVIGTYSAQQFAHGINLAAITTTPQYQQALAVMHLNEERWAIERRLREYYWIHYSILKPKGLLFNDGDATVDSLQKYGKKDFFVAATFPTYQKARFKAVRDAWQKEIDLLTDQLYTINKPVPHRFDITLVN
ncbi:SGNH/GDSL hydrolase family protein [Mucilaginibacter sp. 14171R-50]|uniref:SGNH/GDSL hydrolase family protein n=1 Tax=Mucilaginibacter sp. 14171R-50 TaxID=2703789 RepID=UPI00138BD9A6|nr:SGNH/GDSL hydrolase family protein [Mucilaginibacter sp. 14171R-50]QHS57510.1 SGNH/GDSL hydrolase family protein [Mucilaginibacter sp. 14171R-50]